MPPLYSSNAAGPNNQNVLYLDPKAPHRQISINDLRGAEDSGADEFDEQGPLTLPKDVLKGKQGGGSHLMISSMPRKGPTQIA